MRRLKFVSFINSVLLLALSASAQWTNSGTYADSARAASVADSAKAVRVAGAVISADAVTQYTSSKDTLGLWSDLKVRPWKQVFDVDGSNSARGGNVSGTSLDPGYSDYAISIVAIPESSTVTNNGFLFHIYSSDGSRQIFVRQESNKFKVRFKISTTYDVVSTYATTAGEPVYLFVYIDRDGYMYLYINGALDATVDISALADSSFSYGTLTFGLGVNVAFWGERFYGKILDARVCNFGPNSTVDHTELARRLAERPRARLSEIGFGEWEDADWTEKVTDGSAESGLPQINGSNPSSPSTTTLSQSSAYARTGTYSVAVAGDGATAGAHYMEYYKSVLEDFLEDGVYYELEAYVYIPSSNTDLTDAVAWAKNDATGETWTGSVVTTTGQWAHISVVFKYSNGNVRIQPVRNTNSVATSEAIYVDDISLHRVGEVAFWKFNDASSSSVFADETSNSNNLTPYKSGSATTAGELQATATLNHFWQDYIHGDTLSAERIWVGTAIVPRDSAGPSGGADVGTEELHFDDVWAQHWQTAAADVAEAWRVAGGFLKGVMITGANAWRRALFNIPAWKAKEIVVTLSPEKPTLQDSTSWMPLKRYFKVERKGGGIALTRKRQVPDTLYLWYRPTVVRAGDVVILDLDTPDPFDVKLCNVDAYKGWWGVVSSDPALVMGRRLMHGGVPVAYVGRVPAKVKGPVKAGQLLVTDGKGHLRALKSGEARGVKLAVALKGFDEAVVKKIPVLLQ